MNKSHYEANYEAKHFYVDTLGQDGDGAQWKLDILELTHQVNKLVADPNVISVTCTAGIMTTNGMDEMWTCIHYTRRKSSTNGL